MIKLICTAMIMICAALLITSCSHFANTHKNHGESVTDRIYAYANKTYGKQLSLTPDEVRQLAWVNDNPIATPEMATKDTSHALHVEIKRALTRLYCLQLLKEGSETSYQYFIAPQIGKKNVPLLNKKSFNSLSSLIQALNPTAFETLKTAAIISAVTLSPLAKKRAQEVLKIKLPSDSMQFLATTAPVADKIYPLAQQLIKRYPAAEKDLETVFMPNSHFRHMMYNEGSFSMYSTMLAGIANRHIDKNTLNLWYAHWVINIAGFSGQVDPTGSLYLDQNTYNAMSTLKSIFDSLVQGASLNPMNAYLKKRAEWLGLSNLTQDENLQIALAGLGASLRLFTPAEGKALFEGVNALDNTVRKQWLVFAQAQLAVQSYPAETYLPAVFANTKKKVGLTESISIILPLYVSVLIAEKEMRAEKPVRLQPNTPVSFRQLAENKSIDMLIAAKRNTYSIKINPTDGIAVIIPAAPLKNDNR
ncbi:MAG: hypothetical protein PUP46_03625 [Endozoicomonas sp. (ex Botrylloides leachii)]|nr:hypothetical protein [Endozoicomonas sp. (ex Botrylloides leachii)]